MDDRLAFSSNTRIITDHDALVREYLLQMIEFYEDRRF